MLGQPGLAQLRQPPSQGPSEALHMRPTMAKWVNARFGVLGRSFQKGRMKVSFAVPLGACWNAHLSNPGLYRPEYCEIRPKYHMK